MAIDKSALPYRAISPLITLDLVQGRGSFLHDGDLARQPEARIAKMRFGSLRDEIC